MTGEIDALTQPARGNAAPDGSDWHHGDDDMPPWKKWSAIGAAVCVGFVASLLLQRFMNSATNDEDATPAPAQTVEQPSSGPSSDRRPSRADSVPSQTDLPRESAPIAAAAAVEHRQAASSARAAIPDRANLSPRELAVLDELIRDGGTNDERGTATEPPAFFGHRPKSAVASRETLSAAAVATRRPNEVRQAPPQPRESAAARPQGPGGVATLKYWNAMNSIIDQEAGMRAAPLAGLSNGNARDFQKRRIAAGKFASTGIRGLETAGVDADAVQLGARVATWYADGVAICEKGQFLLEKADEKTRKGAQGKEWQEADKAHQQSVNEINAAGELVRQRLAARYRLSFPPLK